jgi:hypothetical protein
MWPARPPAKPRRIETPALRSARRLLGRLLQALAKAGHVRQRQQTLESLVRDLQRAGRLPAAITGAIAAYQEVRFGGAAFLATHEQQLLLGIEAAQQLEPLLEPLTATISAAATPTATPAATRSGAHVHDRA